MEEETNPRIKPEEIHQAVINNKLNKDLAIQYLSSILDNDTDELTRVSCVRILGKLNVKNESIFKILESCLVSDKSALVRKVAVENIFLSFQEKALTPLKWSIVHEKSPIVIKTIIEILKNCKYSGFKILREILKERIEKLYLVNFEEGLFLLVLQSIWAEKESEWTKIGLKKFYSDNYDKKRRKESFISPHLFALPNAEAHYRIKSNHVISLYLRRCGLKRIPDSISSLTRLKRLAFPENYIEELPSSMKTLSRLKILSLSGNNFKEIPNFIGSLKNLKYLSISDNYQLKVIPNWLDTFIKEKMSRSYKLQGVNCEEATALGALSLYNGCGIEKLKIGRSIQNDGGHGFSKFKMNDSGNVIGLYISVPEAFQIWFLPKQLKNLKKLEELDFRFNKIRYIPKLIGELSALRKLNLWHNEIRFIPTSIGNLQHLESLNLGNNKIRYIPDSIGKLKNLKKLFLYNNKISSMPDSIGKLSKLKLLHIEGNNLQQLTDSIGSLSSLKDLILSNNKLSDLPESIGQLENLEGLSIDGNYIKDIPDFIKKLPNVLLQM